MKLSLITLISGISLTSAVFAETVISPDLNISAAQEVAKQVYTQLGYEVLEPICTLESCTSNLVKSNNEISGFVSTAFEYNQLNNTARFTFNMYDYESQTYFKSFLVVLSDTDNKYFTNEDLANYAYENGVFPSEKRKKEVIVQKTRVARARIREVLVLVGMELQ
nr:hypothetical protein GTC16762_08990 [Pigmentibacter ruber]